jgi:methyltransferase (TIGR00027 family)
LDPIAKTAYYCCGVRAADAERADPICGDHLAHRFMNAEARAIFALFNGFKNPNGSNVTRHRIIDDWLRERLSATPGLRVVLLGAGFDTRAFRLRGGRWVELDQPHTIAVKEAELPIEQAPNPLSRVAIDFAVDALGDKLAPWEGESPTVVVMEGVNPYLSDDTRRRTLDVLVKTFPGHVLICDLMTARFIRRYSGGIRRRIKELGGSFAEPADDPTRTFVEAGYRLLVHVSIIDRARELGAVSVPRWLLNTLLRSLRDGYQAYIFEATHRP